MAEDYLHGFEKKEQARLLYQAKLFEPYIFQNIDYSQCSRILEVGSGVGGQTQILLERYPHLKIDCVDASLQQIRMARQVLSKPLKQNRVKIFKRDATQLQLKQQYDGAFVCWLLEHVADPVRVLGELKKHLRPRGVVYCNEVMNATFFVHPYSPATIRYWMQFNDYQWEIKGDPFTGAKLGNHLKHAGFSDIETKVLHVHMDDRNPEGRAKFLKFWTSLLLSGAPHLLSRGRVTKDLVREMKGELSRIQKDPQSVFFYSWVQAKGYKPV